MSHLIGTLVRRALDFLKDAPPDSARVQHATQSILDETAQARSYCAQVIAAASRARIELQRASAEYLQLLSEAVEKEQGGDHEEVRRLAERLVELQLRREALEQEYQSKEQQARAAQEAYHSIEAEARKRLADAREVVHLDAINRIRAAMLDSIAEFQRTRAQAEYDEAADRVRAEAAKMDAKAQLAGERLAAFQQHLRTQADEPDVQQVVEAIRQAAQAKQNPQSQTSI